MPRTDPLARYATQIRVKEVGKEGQERLLASRALVVGAGALGCAISQQLVRGGVGSLLLVDPDRVELGNLHRQMLFTEADALARERKVEAAARQLRAANSSVEVETDPRRFEPSTAEELLEGAQVVIDGTDNLATRFLINRCCLEAHTPWVYGGVAGTHGMVMPIVPGQTACLACLFDEPGPGRERSTAETDGVFGPAPALVGALQAAAAMQLLVDGERASSELCSVDLWSGRCESIRVKASPDCPVCSGGGSAAGVDSIEGS